MFSGCVFELLLTHCPPSNSCLTFQLPPWLDKDHSVEFYAASKSKIRVYVGDIYGRLQYRMEMDLGYAALAVKNCNYSA